MKNKGFTLVELIAVIAILGIILIIAVPNVMEILSSSREKISDEQKLAVENAARAWGLKNLYVDDNGVSSTSISIKKLQDEKFLENKSFQGIDKEKAGVCISYSDNQFVYNYINNIDDCGKDDTSDDEYGGYGSEENSDETEENSDLESNNN